MKFSNFIFPAAETPEDDGRVIRESVAEAQLCDRLGVDTVWLAEHHFDGICAYVDPVSFAAALATCTENIKSASPWPRCPCTIRYALPNR